MRKIGDTLTVLIGLAGIAGLAFCLMFPVAAYLKIKQDKESETRPIVEFEMVRRNVFNGSGVMVDRKTGVIYYYAVIGGKSGITPVLKSDGKPLLYSDIEEELR